MVAQAGCVEESRPFRERVRFPAFEVSSSYEEYAREGAFARGSHACVECDCEKSSGGEETDANSASVAADAASNDVTWGQQIDAVLTCIGSQNSLREVLYKTLTHCEQPRDFSEVEDFVSSQDEYVYSHIIQTPFTLIQMLLHCGGLNQKALDAEGAEVTDDRCEGLGEDEVDDLIATYEIEATPAGKAAASLVSPARRLEAQLAQKPHRRDTYYALMEFCEQPRTFPEIQEFFKETPGLAMDKVQVHHTLSPDYYVDRLDKAGVLVWQGAWVVNDAGRQALAKHRAHSASLGK